MPPRFVSAAEREGKVENGERRARGTEEKKEEGKMERRVGGKERCKCRELRGGREAVGKWIIRKAQLKDNLYFINAAKLHYCSHTQSYCPHSSVEGGLWDSDGGRREGNR